MTLLTLATGNDGHPYDGFLRQKPLAARRRRDRPIMRSGELFAGVGGLGMAVDDVFNASPAWFCEFDAAPSKVLAHHFPDVPNFGDVRAVDWATTERVNILAGGFPCQDVSLAGRRRGMRDGTRSGLWSEFAKAIDEIRPDWVVIENVRGLLSADAAGHVEPCPLCVGDNPEHVLRALGAVLGDLADLGFDAEWTGIRAADIGAPHGRFRVFILAWPRERTAQDASGGRGWGRPVASGSREGTWADAPADRADTRDDRASEPARLTLLPTPTASEGEKGGPNQAYGSGGATLSGTVPHLLPTPDAYSGSRGGSQHPEKRRDGGHTVSLADVAEFTLLPTPVAQPSGNTPEEHLRKKPGREVVTDLAILAENGLIESGGRLMPTPRASRGGSATETMYGLGTERVDDARTQGQAMLLPTPNVAMAEGGQTSRSGDRKAELLLGGIVAERATGWGPYAAAIAHWEQVTDRPAPAPVRFDGKGGKARLNPELTEWMMGWPAGWVTAAVIGLSRAEQLKACGNGVVPQQAAAALRILLARPGVPDIEYGLAA